MVRKIIVNIITSSQCYGFGKNVYKYMCKRLYDVIYRVSIVEMWKVSFIYLPLLWKVIIVHHFMWYHNTIVGNVFQTIQYFYCVIMKDETNG